MQHILVCLDFSELSKQVIPFAVALAQGFGAKITVLHVLEKPHLDPHVVIDIFEWEMKKNEAKQYLNAIKSEIGNDGVSVTTETIEGQAAAQINLWINNHNVDLTVLCSHGSNGQTQWPLASTAQKLIAGTSSAILLIPAKSLEKYKSNGINVTVFFRRLLVPLDGSNYAESVLPFAINIASYQHGEVLLAHVIPDSGITHIEPLNSEGLALEQHILDYNWNIASHYLRQIESRLKSTTDISVNTSLINNQGVSHELNKIVSAQGIDMVIMSAYGNSNHQEQCCGKVALDFLEHCQIPVMLLRGQISQGKISNSLLESKPRLPSQAIL
ncbi:MAG: nucleotide-binding universal stress UspA family protein [Colwellia sp.]|jgi:nucleotide-binding universal stress UspA family protein